MIFRTITMLTALLLTTTAVADSFYCSSKGGNGYINIGDNMAQVQATCGPPATVSQQQTPASTQVQTQDWIYSGALNITVVNNNSMQSVNLSQIKSPMPQNPLVAFRVVNNQVTAIKSAMQGDVSEFRCPLSGEVVTIGSTAKQLSEACGQPSTLNNTTHTVNVTPQLIVYWAYQMNSFSQPVMMQFQNGVLTQIKQ